MKDSFCARCVTKKRVIGRATGIVRNERRIARGSFDDLEWLPLVADGIDARSRSHLVTGFVRSENIWIIIGCITALGASSTIGEMLRFRIFRRPYYFKLAF